METQRKKYVKVNADHYADGTVMPHTIQIDGRIYEITSVCDARKLSEFSCDEGKMRYEIMIEKYRTLLFKDRDRWFVHEKIKR